MPRNPAASDPSGKLRLNVRLLNKITVFNVWFSLLIGYMLTNRSWKVNRNELGYNPG
jgi:hypothetical protein